MRNVQKKYSKASILSIVAEIDIYAHYLSLFNSELDVKTIDYLANTNRKIKNPLRSDNNASLGFRYTKGRLKMKDFAGYFWGDCFDLVGKIIHVNVNHKEGFMIVLKQIVSDMKLDIMTNEHIKPISIKPKSFIKRPYIIQPTFRNWNTNDYKYWGNKGVSFQTLNSFFVFPLLEYRVIDETGSTLKYVYDLDNPAYGYYNGKDKDGIPKWDLYFPLHRKDKPKFIKSHLVIQGLLNYKPKADILLIVKSLKDAMSIYELMTIYYSKYSVTYIVPPSESVPFTKEQLDYFINNHIQTYVLYDFDYTGVKNSNKIRREYPVEQLFFTNGRFESKDYKNKDFSEYYENEKQQNVFKIVNEILKNYDEKQQDSMEKDGHF